MKARTILGYVTLGCALLGCEDSGPTPPPKAAPPIASSAPPAPPPPPPSRCVAVGDRVATDGLREHLEALAEIARVHGNRARSSGGYQASVAYVETQLRQAGLSPTRADFDVVTASTDGPGSFEIVGGHHFAPGADRLRVGDFVPIASSPPGDVSGRVVPIDVTLGLGNESTSGCSVDDFAQEDGTSAVRNAIALMQRGTCPFLVKVRNAQAAGATAAIVFNQGDTTARRGLLSGDLGNGDHHIHIPAVFVTTDVGERLIEAAPVEIRIGVDTSRRIDRVANVVVDVPGRSPDVFMVGAHLDSVEKGPGMNDNASGSVAILEIAKRLGRCEAQRTVRFAWWGAEEEGLIGSTHYVSALSHAEQRHIVGYVNLDMIAAPNHAFMLTDGDGSQFSPPGPGSSRALERFFRSDFDAHDEGLIEVRYIRRSDDRPFFDAGIGVVGLGAGYDGKKTAAEARLFGGKGGERYDACYHRACDDLSNVNMPALRTITRSVARAVDHFGLRGAAL